MNIAELDGRIGEGWGGLSPNGAHVNVVLAHRGSPTAAAAISMFAHPRPATRPSSAASGAASRSTADLAADADDEQGHRDTPHIETMTWGPGQARDRPGCARLGRGRADRGDGRPHRARRDLARRSRERRDEVRLATRTAVRKAIGMCVEGRDPRAARALVEQRDTVWNPFYSGT
jgi:hypothetical protein